MATIDNEYPKEVVKSCIDCGKEITIIIPSRLFAYVPICEDCLAARGAMVAAKKNNTDGNNLP